ncbi:MAG: hypothetical protein ABI885_18565, partial [Gammaproteobacteria bacterium]
YPKPRVVGLGATISWFLANVLRARLNGSYRYTPFFDVDSGTPVVQPRVLTHAEHEQLMR